MIVSSINRADIASDSQIGTRTVPTGILKKPVAGPVKIEKLGLPGDTISDTRHHGGPFKAVYVYGAQHYAHFEKQYPDLDFPHGFFGENFTLKGDFDESKIMLGDLFRVGTVLLEAAEPRCPCATLGWRFGDQKAVKKFAQSGFFGVYFRVIEEGHVQAGDAFTLEKPSHSGLSIRKVGTWMCTKKGDRAEITAAVKNTGISSPYVREKLKGMLG